MKILQYPHATSVWKVTLPSFTKEPPHLRVAEAEVAVSSPDHPLRLQDEALNPIPPKDSTPRHQCVGV